MVVYSPFTARRGTFSVVCGVWPYNIVSRPLSPMLCHHRLVTVDAPPRWWRSPSGFVFHTLIGVVLRRLKRQPPLAPRNISAGISARTLQLTSPIPTVPLSMVETTSIDAERLLPTEIGFISAWFQNTDGHLCPFIRRTATNRGSPPYHSPSTSRSGSSGTVGNPMFHATQISRTTWIMI